MEVMQRTSPHKKHGCMVNYIFGHSITSCIPDFSVSLQNKTRKKEVQTLKLF
jgi:hypothetical protein